jgi:predicted alpha/beta hydrolase family esterase
VIANKLKNMKKRVFIIHGWEGTPDSNWFPWIKEELEKHDFEVFVPQMPHADFPQQVEWVKYMQELIGDVDENTFLVGHSLGVIAILRFLESLPAGQKIGGAILVAGFSEPLDPADFSALDNFFDKQVDYEKIKSSCGNFVAIHSDDDPYVPMERGETLKNKLDAKLIVLHAASHINMGAGHFDLPIAVEELLKISEA